MNGRRSDRRQPIGSDVLEVPADFRIFQISWLLERFQTWPEFPDVWKDSSGGGLRFSHAALTPVFTLYTKTISLRGAADRVLSQADSHASRTSYACGAFVLAVAHGTRGHVRSLSVNLDMAMQALVERLGETTLKRSN